MTGSRTGFASDVLKLSSGAVFGLGLSALSSPILARLYAPHAYGLAAVFLSITGIVGVVACLRYELAIMLPGTREEAANLLGLSLLFAGLISLLTLALVFLLKAPLLRLLKSPELAPCLVLIPGAVFLNGAFYALNHWNARTRKYGRLSFARVTNASTVTAAQLSAGLTGHGTGAMRVASIFLGSAVSTVILGGQIWRDDRALFRHSIRWHHMLQGLRRYRRFPVYDTWSALFETISWQLPAFLLAAFFSPAVVGYYAFGAALLSVPMNLVGRAIGQVFFQRAAEARRAGSLAAIVETAFRRLVSIGLFPFLLLTLVGAEAFAFAFGARWTEAGVYSQLLGLSTFLWFVTAPMGTLFSVLEKQKFGLALNIGVFVTRLLSLCIGGWLHSARLAMLLFGLSGILVYGYFSLKTMAFSGVPWRRMVRVLASSALVFLPAGVVVLSLKLLRVHPWILLAVSFVLFGSYVIYTFAKDPQLRMLFGRARMEAQPEPEPETPG